jgi:formiminotetrahydrofolate cyclodeaminase
VEQATNDPFGELSVREFVARLASGEPVPGGGSASAVAGSLAASLVAMVATLSEGRPKYVAHADLHARARAEGESLAARLLGLADDDAEAYAGFAAALKLPRETPAEAARRGAAMETAARRASEVPLACVEACLQVVVAAEALAGRSNRNAASDLNVAALLAEAAARGAAANVLVNLPSLPPGDPFVGDAIARVDRLLHDIGDLARATREVVQSGQTREPLDAAAVGRSG